MIETILVVGEVSEDREVLVGCLRDAGFGVIEAEGTRQALQHLADQRIALLIVDCGAEALPCQELLEDVRSRGGPPVPILCCADPERETRLRHVLAGRGIAAGFIAKPVQPEAILQALAGALSAAPEQTAAAGSSGFFGSTLPGYLHNLDKLRQRLVQRMDAAIERPSASARGVSGDIARSFHDFNSRLAALLETSVALSAAREPQAMMELFCRRARSILTCRHAAIGILAIEGSNHLALATSGLGDGAASSLQASNPTGTVLGEILLRPDPIRLQAAPGERSHLGLPAFLPPVRSLLVVPVAVRAPDALSGWLYFADKEGGAAFDDDDEHVAATLAAQFVLAYGNLTLYDEVQRHACALEAEAAEHRHTAEALRDSEQRFRQIATHIDSAFFLSEPDCSCIHYVSPAYETLWDRTCAGLYERPLSWLEPVHADDRQRVRETFLRRSGAGLAFEIEFRVLRTDGSPRWILLRGFPIRNGSSKPYRTAAVAVDVSAARRAQDELQASNRRFTELLDNVELVSVMLDRAARVTYCNEYLLQLTGWRRAEVLGCDWIEEFIPPEVDDMRAKFAALLRGDGEIEHLENEILTRAGERRLIRWNNTVLRSPQGDVIGVASIGEDVTEQRRAQAELAYSLNHDLVTGLPRFGQMGDYLETVFVEAAAREGRVIVCYVDLDRFHTLNETRGRMVGDYVLRLVGGRLSELAGSDGRVAHIAGDEFAIILKDPSIAHDQFEFGETVRNAIEEPIEHNHRHIYITCSVGVSCFPDNGATPQELLRQAESAMLKAKHEGRNTVFAFANEHRQELEDRLTLGLRLDEALENAEFLLHYQPRISGQDWRICGFEALLRWDSPEFGLLPPKRFHQVAEDLGMMIDIGNYVLAAACRQARAWIDAGADDFSISINISPAQMQRALFVDELRRALAEAALPARYIELELTEGMTNGNFDRVIGTMRALKALGVKLSLDDFGTGYSSLNYLRKFPIDTLKIDQSFVRDISTDVGATGVCRAIITLAHQLGMTVLAEGVETAAQVGYLRRNDCDFFQGYYFCKPVPAAKAFQLLQHRYLPHEGLEQTATQPTLLLVDDEENILNALTRMLRRDGYRILTAKGAEEALDVLARSDVQVILSDQRMPGASGTEFLSKVKEMYPETVRMVLSGYTELAAVTAAINQGAIYKFITKPWNDEELRTQIRDAFRIANRADKAYKREIS